MGPVLLVIDMQEHFREMAEGCLPPLNALIDTCHSLGIPVIYTQHGHLDPEAEAPFRCRNRNQTGTEGTRRRWLWEEEE